VDVFRCGARDYCKKTCLLGELVLIVRALLGLQKTPSVPPRANLPDGLGKAFKYIQNNCKSPLSFAQVAELSSMRVSCFSRCFKKKTGMTFVDYVNSLRVSNAIRLLKEARLLLLDVKNLNCCTCLNS
jgi:transcriptional regulator GlxA family with amidase domain